MKIIGVGRLPRFSPNSEQRDTAILQAVAGVLRDRGNEVELLEEDVCSLPSQCDGIFSMARNEATLRFLCGIQDELHIPVLNNPAGVMMYTRSKLTLLMEQLGIPAPLSVVLPFRESSTSNICEINEYSKDVFLDAFMRRAVNFTYPLWVKRGDMCAQMGQDVAYVETAEALSAALRRLAGNGATSAVVSTHIEGDLVKFYGVEGTDFFFTTYPVQTGCLSKFGLERFNSELVGFPFSPEKLRADAERIATETGIMVYGGDCIVTADGECRIIDFNDWPSFAPCRERAAIAIAEKLSGML